MNQTPALLIHGHSQQQEAGNPCKRNHHKEFNSIWEIHQTNPSKVSIKEIHHKDLNSISEMNRRNPPKKLFRQILIESKKSIWQILRESEMSLLLAHICAISFWELRMRWPQWEDKLVGQGSDTLPNKVILHIKMVTLQKNDNPPNKCPTSFTALLFLEIKHD